MCIVWSWSFFCCWLSHRARSHLFVQLLENPPQKPRRKHTRSSRHTIICADSTGEIMPNPSQRPCERPDDDAGGSAAAAAAATSPIVAANSSEEEASTQACSERDATAAAAEATTTTTPTCFADQRDLDTILELLHKTPERIHQLAGLWLAILCADVAAMPLCLRALHATVTAEPVMVVDDKRSRLVAQFCRAVGEAGASVAQWMWADAFRACDDGRGRALTLAALEVRTNAVARRFRRCVVDDVQVGSHVH